MGNDNILTLARRVARRVRGDGRLGDVADAFSHGRLARTQVDGVETTWLILNPGDEIQSAQCRDGYYELEQLRAIRSLCGSPATVIDVGANIGNHSLYFARHMGARTVVPVEPFAPTIRHLLINLSLNYSSAFDLSLVGLGLGGRSRGMAAVPPSAFNTGLTRLVEHTAGAEEIRVVTGDEALARYRVDLLKIDVEGMEMEVLSGLGGVLAHDKPDVFIEVVDALCDEVGEVMARAGYARAYRDRMYEGCENFLFKARG